MQNKDSPKLLPHQEKAVKRALAAAGNRWLFGDEMGVVPPRS